MSKLENDTTACHINTVQEGPLTLRESQSETSWKRSWNGATAVYGDKIKVQCVCYTDINTALPIIALV